jgi:fumarate hydratase class I
VALEMLKNAVISAEMEFPMCQDTGTAIVMGKKGQQVWTGFSDEKALSKGVFNAYTQTNCAIPRMHRLPCMKRRTPGATCRPRSKSTPPRAMPIPFLFIAKGGGSANKTYLFQETKAVLNPGTLVIFSRPK